MKTKDLILKELDQADLTAEELSERLGINLNTIRTNIFRLREAGFVKGAGYKNGFDGRGFKLYTLKKHSKESNLLFLMKLFERNGQTLFQKDKDFIIKHKARFEAIQQQINEVYD